jgi:2-oxoglutarate dehydrogenase complex dehydrogenase (E1) component-like enzyme
VERLLKELQEPSKTNISLDFPSLPIAVHGDAAIAGQGIFEIIQMAQLDGYKTGGTIHCC